MNMQEHPYAFTGRFNMFRGRIVSEIVICSPDDADLVSTKIRALWDTGCSQSIISKRVADFLRLQPDNKQQFRSPFGGTAICDVAKVRLCVVLGGIRIPIDAAINTKPNSDPDCDITLGLDFITMGDFAISHLGESLFLSFCYPPVGAPIDYRPPMVILAGGIILHWEPHIPHPGREAGGSLRRADGGSSDGKRGNFPLLSLLRDL